MATTNYQPKFQLPQKDDVTLSPLTWEAFRRIEAAINQINGLLTQFVGGQIAITGTGLTITGLKDFANNAAAIAGGLKPGNFYMNTGVDPVQVCVVT